MSSDSRRFLMLREVPVNATATDPAHIVVVLDWGEELAAKLPVRRE